MKAYQEEGDKGWEEEMVEESDRNARVRERRERQQP